MPLVAGQILLRRYVITGNLGGGGQAIVYLAEDNHLPGQKCAIKELSPNQLSPRDLGWAIPAFQQEAHLLAQLNHPGVVRVGDYFEESGNWYLVMDYVPGQTLGKWLEQMPGGLPLNTALNYTVQLCDVLDYLHTQTPPVIFRDLKPDNIMVTPNGEIKLIDFGIARFFKPGQTHNTVNLGTPGYASPEHGSSGQTDPRSDIYSLGVVLHEMLTGYDPTRTPFHLPPARTLNPDIPPSIEAAIQRAIQFDPVNRFATIAEFRQALVGQSAPPPVLPPHRTISRWLLVGGVLLAVLIVVGLLLSQPESLLPASPSFTSTPNSFTTQTTAPPPTATPMRTPTPANTPLPVDGLIAYEVGDSAGSWQIRLADPARGADWLLPNQPANSGVPSWLPDGQHLAFRSNVSGSWQIYSMKIDGTELRQITSGSANNTEANYSPDGSRIVFVSDGDGNKEIYIMDRDGQNQRRLTNSSGIDDDPNWSPDGERIAFESKRGGRMDVYLIRPDGTGLTRLTDQGKSDSTPAWSPDGKWIAFERDDGTATHIWVMDAQGHSQRQITFDGTWNVRPAWSPNGLELVYNSDREGADAVWSSPIDGSSPPLRVSSGEGYDPAWSR